MTLLMEGWIKKAPLGVREMVTKPKLKARLGVLRLRLQNDVLLMKNLPTLGASTMVQVLYKWTSSRGS
jgi:hypothetical protein